MTLVFKRQWKTIVANFRLITMERRTTPVLTIIFMYPGVIIFGAILMMITRIMKNAKVNMMTEGSTNMSSYKCIDLCIWDNFFYSTSALTT